MNNNKFKQKDMGLRINARLRELGLRQVDVVKATGASKGAVSTWVNGSSSPQDKYLVLLSSLLKTTPHWLMTGKYDDDMERKNREFFLSLLALKDNGDYDTHYLMELFADKLQKEEDDTQQRIYSLMEPAEALVDRDISDSCYDFNVYIHRKPVCHTNKSVLEKTDETRRVSSEIALMMSASRSDTFCYYNDSDSMTPKIDKNFQCFADSSKKDVRDGQVYVFRHGVLLRTRYLYRQPDGGLLIRCENKAYADEIVPVKDLANIEILGWVYSWIGMATP
ncbi:S24 family peptidase [Psychrobacter immobilis]|uniref:S24 family peptidase n=1 Tax=Psychrobacter immobilis TaxID=498 RepID=UPI00191ABD5C|nr:S24 family peptidase [Psychrobacter immobilis]